MDAAVTPHLVLSAELTASGQDDRALARACRAGSLTRIGPGAYVPSPEWSTFDPRQQHLHRAVAVQRKRRRGLVLSHETAAIAWGLPSWGWPRGPAEFVDPGGGAPRSEHLVRIRAAALGQEDVVDLDGVLVTSMRRTVLDLLTTRGRQQAVVLVDDVLHRGRLERAELADLIGSRPSARARRRAAWAVGFGDAGAESPGESVSRVCAHDSGLVAPVLQKECRDADGLIGYADFFFPDPACPERGSLGEFDGEVKYLGGAHRAGRTPEQVVLDEKLREDRLRAMPTTVGLARWTRHDLARPGRLAQLLFAAGTARRR
ncbi:type IV toxin-antitoxin system AbiEi family antitoxin domain-containing protein [Frigoribacterium sp. PvP032]|uniref:type IV toxin-antitoxin system AbiEi family antitoxin domain-containing protein n=1 Tax=Frigoribacterium sp. PvP032 TaxID=2806589 RepID=UPI001AE404DB|nr:type IV toxin-antitoxin system AbiEi family antitoxin domain-containing protein [Frigoribacterium sp. PvP032]MBP1191874.1 hypothetical protein [Frigoribacterium sp. PvP032]